MEFDVHVDRGSLATGRDWHLIKQVRSMKDNTIRLSVLTPFPTDRIRLRVLETKDDVLEARAFGARMPGWRPLSNRRAAGKIREIEFYGYKTFKQVEAEQATERLAVIAHR